MTGTAGDLVKVNPRLTRIQRYVTAGALIGLGIPEEEAKYYEGEVHAGRTVVTVQAAGRFDEAWQLLTRHGAYDMHSADGVRTAAPAQTNSRVP